MNSRYSVALLVIAVASWLPQIGCEESTSSSGTSEMDRMAAMLNQPKEQPPAEQTQPVAATPVETPPVETQTAPAEEEAGEDLSQAQVVTKYNPKRGKRTRATGGYMGAVLSARFTAENSMTLNKVIANLNWYRGEHGYYPKTHEEFMQKIIKDQIIVLPDLDEGWEYIYDPQEEEVDKMLKMRPIDDATAEADPVSQAP